MLTFSGDPMKWKLKSNLSESAMNASKLVASVMLTTTSGHVSFARFLPPYPTKLYCQGVPPFSKPS